MYERKGVYPMIFGTTRIDGRYWLVMLPDGGNARGLVSGSQFNMMIALAGKENFHTEMATICENLAREERIEDDGGVWTAYGRVTRYDEQECNWDCDTNNYYRSTALGFRPVLVPLCKANGAPDDYFMATFADGKVVNFGTLYMNGIALENPTNPVRCEGPDIYIGEPIGDCPRYADRSDLIIGNTSEDPRKQIRFVKTGSCFVSDRVILGCVSYQDLEENLRIKAYRGSKSLVAGYYTPRRRSKR